MKVLAIDPTANKFHDIDAGAAGHVPSFTDVMRSNRANELAVKHDLDRDMLQEWEDERETDELARVICNDDRVTPWGVEVLLMGLTVNENGRRVASKDQRHKIREDYELFLELKKRRDAEGG